MEYQINVQRQAQSLSNAIVRSATENIPVDLPQLVIGTNRKFKLRLISGGAVDTLSGNASVGVFVSIGERCAVPSAGTFTFTRGANTTAALANDLTPAALQAALEGLASIGSGNVTVEGVAGKFYRIEYIGALAGTAISDASADGSELTPASNAKVSRLVEGGSGENEVQILRLQQVPVIAQATWTPDTDGWTGTLNTGSYEALVKLNETSPFVGLLEVTITLPTGEIEKLTAQEVEVYCDISDPASFIPASFPTYLTASQTNALVDAVDDRVDDLTDVTIENLKDYNGLVGGAATDLDSIATTTLPLGKMVAINLAVGSFVLTRVYELVSTTAATNQPFFVRPTDYAASTNERVWRLRDVKNSAPILTGIAIPTTLNRLQNDIVTVTTAAAVELWASPELGDRQTIYNDAASAVDVIAGADTYSLKPHRKITLVYNGTKWLQELPNGLSRSDYTCLYVSTTLTATVAAAGTFVKLGSLAGATLQGLSSGGWTHTSPNRLTKDNPIGGRYMVTATMDITHSTNNTTISIVFYKNGSILAPTTKRAKIGTAGDIDAISTQCFVEIADTDYIEVWVTADNTGTITTEFLNLTIKEID